MTRTVRAWVQPTAIAASVDGVGVLPVFLTGAMAIQLRTAIGLEVHTIGYLFAVYFAAAAVLAAPAGAIGERVGPAWTLRIGVALYVVVFIGAATVGSVAVLALWLCLAGVATSITRTSSSLLVARAVPADRQGIAFGIRNSAIPGAALFSGLAVPGIALTVGWRWAFVTAAGIAGTLFLLLPSRIPGPTIEDGGMVDDLPTPVSVWLAIVASLASVAAVSLGAYTVVTAVYAGIPEAAAGMLVAVGSIVGVGSRIGVGLWTDRRQGSQFDIVAAMIFIGALSYLLISSTRPVVIWLAVPVAYATGWAFYGAYYLTIIRLNPKAPGFAIGLAQAGAFSGSIIGPIVLGAIASRYSFGAAWIAAAGASLAAAGTLYAVHRHIERLGRHERTFG